MSINTTTAATITAPAPAVVPGQLPDGDALLNEMIAGSVGRDVKSLKRATKSKGSKINYEPRGWTMNGNVD